MHDEVVLALGAVAPVIRPNLSVSMMSLEQVKQHKWRRNSQGLILLTRSPELTHDQSCLGPTCTRCGKWYSAYCEPEDVECCPPRIYIV